MRTASRATDVRAVICTILLRRLATVGGESEYSHRTARSLKLLADEVLRVPDVLRRLKVSRATLSRMQQRGDFPKPGPSPGTARSVGAST